MRKYKVDYAVEPNCKECGTPLFGRYPICGWCGNTNESKKKIISEDNAYFEARKGTYGCEEICWIAD